MPDFFSYLRTLFLEIVLRSKLLYENLSKYAGINTIENMVHNKSLSTGEIADSHAELYFHLKKFDQNKINLPLCKHIKESNNFRIVRKRQFIDKLTKNAYIKGSTKRQCATIKQAFVKNCDDIDDKHNSVPSPEIEVETWTPKKEIKKKKDNNFSSPPATPINFMKNLPQTPTWKRREKYKEEAKTDKFREMGSSKIQENHNKE